MAFQQAIPQSAQDTEKRKCERKLQALLHTETCRQRKKMVGEIRTLLKQCNDTAGAAADGGCPQESNEQKAALIFLLQPRNLLLMLCFCITLQVTHMPPELLAEGKISKAADVYSFGVMLWEMYVGERPWAGARCGIWRLALE